MNHFKEKNKKLEKLRGIFFQIGLIIAGGLTLLAFEWKTSYVVEPPICVLPIFDEGEVLPPITFQEIPEKPKVKIIQPTINHDQIDIIDDNVSDVDPTDLIPDVLPDFIPDVYEPTPTTPIENTPFIIVEEMPTFIGGEKAMMLFLKENVKYPSAAKVLEISGTVYVNFIVSKTGKLKNIKVLRGVTKLLDKEAIRVVKAMPDWKPGKQRKQAVEVSYNLPINFIYRK